MTAENRDHRQELEVRDKAGADEGQIRDEELCRMAAFRIRETANRIAILASSAHNDQLRGELVAVCDRLLKEERNLLASTARS